MRPPKPDPQVYTHDGPSVYKETSKGRVHVATFYPRADSTLHDCRLVAAYEARRLNTQEKNIERELRRFRHGR